MCVEGQILKFSKGYWVPMLLVVFREDWGERMWPKTRNFQNLLSAPQPRSCLTWDRQSSGAGSCPVPGPEVLGDSTSTETCRGDPRAPCGNPDPRKVLTYRLGHNQDSPGGTFPQPTPEPKCQKLPSREAARPQLGRLRQPGSGKQRKVLERK